MSAAMVDCDWSVQAVVANYRQKNQACQSKWVSQLTHLHDDDRVSGRVDQMAVGLIGVVGELRPVLVPLVRRTRWLQRRQLTGDRRQQ